MERWARLEIRASRDLMERLDDPLDPGVQRDLLSTHGVLRTLRRLVSDDFKLDLEEILDGPALEEVDDAA